MIPLDKRDTYGGVRLSAQQAMYHVAPKKARQSIAFQGLLPGEDGVWLYANQPTAQDDDRLMPSHEDVYEVDTNGLQMQNAWQDAHVIYRPIEPERIRRIA